jgi:hypothetical protein
MLQSTYTNKHIMRTCIAILAATLLTACGTTEYQKTIASPYLSCTNEDITIEDEAGGWMTAHEGWVATCRGNAVMCVETRDSGGGCNYIKLPK